MKSWFKTFWPLLIVEFRRYFARENILRMVFGGIKEITFAAMVGFFVAFVFTNDGTADAIFMAVTIAVLLTRRDDAKNLKIAKLTTAMSCNQATAVLMALDWAMDENNPTGFAKYQEVGKLLDAARRNIRKSLYGKK